MSKHEREFGIVVFGTDFRAVTQAALRLVCSSLFLAQGHASIAAELPVLSIPRFGKLERVWVLRLLLVRQNAHAAVDEQILADLRQQVPLQHFTTFPRVIKTLSIDLLPHFRWADVRDIMKECRTGLQESFEGWIRHYR